MQKLLEWIGCKEGEIISKIENSRQNGICDFVKVDDHIELQSFHFVEYIKSKEKVGAILIGTRNLSLDLKNKGVNIPSEGKVGVVLNCLSAITIQDHIDSLNEERRTKSEIPVVPGKEYLRELFARAIACLGHIWESAFN